MLLEALELFEVGGGDETAIDKEGVEAVFDGPFGDIVRSLVRATGPTTLDRIGHLRGDLTRLLPELGPPPSVPQGMQLA